jgi:hypothetical protein
LELKERLDTIAEDAKAIKKQRIVEGNEAKSQEKLEKEARDWERTDYYEAEVQKVRDQTTKEIADKEAVR